MSRVAHTTVAVALAATVSNAWYVHDALHQGGLPRHVGLNDPILIALIVEAIVFAVCAFIITAPVKDRRGTIPLTHTHIWIQVFVALMVDGWFTERTSILKQKTPALEALVFGMLIDVAFIIVGVFASVSLSIENETAVFHQARPMRFERRGGSVGSYRRR
jgi:hypothetical protein